MKKNVEFSRRSIRHQYLMSRRLRCASCGYSFVGRTRREKHQYYCCKGRDQLPMSLCDMPYFRGDLVDYTVWEWVKGILINPENIAEGLRGVQEETKKANRAIYERLEIIESQLDAEERQLQRLLDLYLSGNFPKEMLLEKRARLEEVITNLKAEQVQLTNHLQTIAYSDRDISAMEDFCAKIRENKDMVTFESKRHILELMDVRGTLAIWENGKVTYVTCLIGQQLLSVART